jgi:plastocyanin
MIRKRLLAVPLAILAMSGAWTTAAPTAPKPVTVNIIQRVQYEPPSWGFDQMSITIPPGTTVTWKSVPGNSDGHRGLHPWMLGTVNVVAGASAPPTTRAPAPRQALPVGGERLK